MWTKVARRGSLLAFALVHAFLQPAWGADPRPDVTTAPRPDWVTDEPVVSEEPPPTGGVSLVLLEVQSRYVHGEHTRFVRGLVRVANELGVRQAGQRRFDFVPPYERLVLHRLEIRRGSERLPKLKRDDVRVLAQESGLDANVYRGERTAVVELTDLRVGDLIAFEYSVIGSNAVLGGHVMERWLLGLPSGAGALQYRLLSDHPLLAMPAGGAPTTIRPNRLGDLYEYTARASQLSPIEVDADIPAYFEPLPVIQITDFRTWQDVARWGAKLFQLPKEPSKGVESLAARISHEQKTDGGRVLAALRAVQDSVRYVSLSLADSTHKPAPPDLVLERRFGDCKDKSLLLVAVLRAMGLNADVALVSAARGDALPSTLPTIGAFDHAIVCVELEKRRYWLDPTRLYQRGGFADVAARGFHFALPLTDSETDLTFIVEPARQHPESRKKLQYHIEKMGGPATLIVSTTYGGELAEFIRGLHASTSPEEFAKQAGLAVTRAYERAHPFGETTFTDNEEANQLAVTQRFRLDDCWLSEEQGRPAILLTPLWLRDVLPAATESRKSPLALRHPMAIVEDTTITADEGVSVKDLSLDVAPHGFRFKAERHQVNPKTVSVHYEYESKAPSVDSADLAQYRKAVSELEVVRDFVLAKKPDPTPSERFVAWWITGIASIWAVAIGIVLFLVHRRAPYLERKVVPWTPQYAGLKGWLALVGFGVTLAPLRSTAAVAQLAPFFSPQRWASITRSDEAGYTPMLGPILVGELLFNVLTSLLTVHLALLFWKKHRSFPLMFVLAAAVITGGLMVDHLMVSHYVREDEMPLTQILAAVSSFIWCMYVLYSERVKATFLPEPSPEG